MLILTDYDELFICEKCENPLVAGIISIVKDSAICVCKCRKGHKKTIRLPMKEKKDWIAILTKYIYQCRCGNDLTDLKMYTTGDITGYIN